MEATHSLLEVNFPSVHHQIGRHHPINWKQVK